MESNREERFERLRAADFMVPLERYPKVKPSDSLRQAMVVMDQARLDVQGRSSLPRVLLVFDEGGTLVGTVRRRDIMRGLEPPFLGAQPLEYRKKLYDVASDPALTELTYQRTVAGVRKQARRPVRDVMRPLSATVHDDDSIIKVVYTLVTSRRSFLLVLKKERSLERAIGIVRSVEIFRELGRIIRED